MNKTKIFGSPLTQKIESSLLDYMQNENVYSKFFFINGENFLIASKN